MRYSMSWRAQGIFGPGHSISFPGGNPDSVSLEITDPQIKGFTILYDHTSPVEEDLHDIASITPNPLGSQGFLRFFLEQEGFVSAGIMDALGNRVLTLAEGVFSEGRNSIPIDNTNLPSGLYFYGLVVEGKRTTGSFISLR